MAGNDLKGEQQISACGLPFPVNERRLNKTLSSTFTSLARKVHRGKLGERKKDGEVGGRVGCWEVRHGGQYEAKSRDPYAQRQSEAN